MSPRKQSEIFKPFLTLWTIFGIWLGKNANHKYKYYICVNILITLMFNNILGTINLCYTPREIKYFVPEVIFFINEIAVSSKVFMVINMRNKILEAFNIMDRQDLDEDDETTKKIIKSDNANFNILWEIFKALSHLAYASLVFVPVVLHFAIDAELKLPLSQYHFLSNEFRENYFVYLYTYQSSAIYVHMIYNITVDTFVAGLLLTGATQLKVLNNKLKNLKVNDEDKKLSIKDQDEIQNMKLRNLLIQYGVILRYCNVVQEIISLNMFVIFSFSSIIICAALCEILSLENAIEFFICMVMFLIVTLLQIFVPAYLGTLIDYENSELVFAAYSSEWIPRSKTFNNHLRMFVERANNPIKITGLKMFTMSLTTFTSIVKTAYSFFAVIRNFQE